MRRTKILATVGPASASSRALDALFRAGVNGFRLNLSHGTGPEHSIALSRLRNLRTGPGRDIALVADIGGPKIRIGVLRESSIRLGEGEAWKLDLDPHPGGEERVGVSLPEIPRVARTGDPILLGDGSVELVVERSSPREVMTRVVHGGTVRSQTGLYLPRARLRAPISGGKDRADIRWAVRNGMDFLAISFVRHAEDVQNVRRLVDRLPGGKEVRIIAKIERAEALAGIDGILAAADAIMVARGDLGIEVPLERLAMEQKMLTRRANEAGKPVIVATQMLLSMLTSPRPTRAEATDVANAVLDGADALMLSEETAVGHYPVDSVRWLSRIAESTESEFEKFRFRSSTQTPALSETERCVAAAAVGLAESIQAQAIVTPTHSGRTAQLVAAQRPGMPIVALTSNKWTRRRLALVWGVEAFPVGKHLSLPSLRNSAIKIVRRRPGDVLPGPIVMTAGYPLEGRPTNLVTVVDAR